ncbi:MAG: radical SAM protein [Candidatus Lokiarchaeota archaeon]|nr:radical SAM protein [Candidatus Lokiarchaeota archaeon]
MNNQYIINNKITNEFVEKYTKTLYRIVGLNKHSAIKPCHWLEQRLMTGRDNRNCYKGVFGIQSHRCLQNTPSLPFCNHQCVFCWRDIELGTLGSKFIVEPDEPKELVDEMIRHHQDIIKNHLPLRRYLDNYEIMIDIMHFMLLNPGKHTINSLSRELHISSNKIERAVNLLKNQKFLHSQPSLLNHYVLDGDISCCIDSREEVEKLINLELTDPDDIMAAHGEAMNPNHAAISLDGEVMLFPLMSDFIKEFKDRKMTTFIVTNGTLPNAIENLDALPSQLYITLPAPNEQIYKKVCRPMIKDGWNRVLDTMNLIESLDCRTLIRLTAVKDLNISETLIKEYVKIVEKANPNFFEIKGFTLQAKALLIKERLKSEGPIQDYFPDFNYLHEIALKFEEFSNFPIIYANETSRDILFAVNWDKDENPIIKEP